MKLSDNFALGEFTASATAKRLHINNNPSLDVLANLRRLAVELEKVRAITGKPLKIASGYRAPALNKAVGGSKTSYHMDGCAADFDPPAGWTHDQLQQAIAADTGIVFDMILEEGTAKPESEGGSRWLHFQIPRPGAPARRLVKDAEVDRLGGTIVRIAAG